MIISKRFFVDSARKTFLKLNISFVFRNFLRVKSVIEKPDSAGIRIHAFDSSKLHDDNDNVYNAHDIMQLSRKK